MTWGEKGVFAVYQPSRNLWIIFPIAQSLSCLCASAFLFRSEPLSVPKWTISHWRWSQVLVSIIQVLVSFKTELFIYSVKMTMDELEMLQQRAWGPDIESTSGMNHERGIRELQFLSSLTWGHHDFPSRYLQCKDSKLYQTSESRKAGRSRICLEFVANIIIWALQPQNSESPGETSNWSFSRRTRLDWRWSIEWEKNGLGLVLPSDLQCFLHLLSPLLDALEIRTTVSSLTDHSNAQYSIFFHFFHSAGLSQYNDSPSPSFMHEGGSMVEAFNVDLDSFDCQYFWLSTLQRQQTLDCPYQTRIHSYILIRTRSWWM